MVKKKSSSSAVDFVTSGTYQTDEIWAAGSSVTANTEFKIEELENNVYATGQDELYSWIRMRLWLFATDSFSCWEYAVIRCKTTDATQDLNNESQLEELLKDGRLLRRDIVFCADPDAGPVKPIKFELYNVAIRDGEELRLVVRSFQSHNAVVGEFGRLEWRQVGK